MVNLGFGYRLYGCSEVSRCEHDWPSAVYYSEVNISTSIFNTNHVDSWDWPKFCVCIRKLQEWARERDAKLSRKPFGDLSNNQQRKTSNKCITCYTSDSRVQLIVNSNKRIFLSFLLLFQGDRRPFVTETVKADDAAKFGMFLNLFLKLVCFLNHLCLESYSCVQAMRDAKL